MIVFKIKTIALSLFSFCLVSCKNDVVTKKLIGAWQIKSISIKNQELNLYQVVTDPYSFEIREYVTVMVPPQIGFLSKENCILPDFYGGTYKGKWNVEVKNNKSIISFESNGFFNGDYEFYEVSNFYEAELVKGDTIIGFMKIGTPSLVRD